MAISPALAMDSVAIGVVILSSALALTRGFVREALSIASFVVAALVTIFTLPVFRGVAMNWIQSELIATGITVATVFLVTYLVMAYATAKVSGVVKLHRHIGVLDRTAGFAFGAVRGMVLLAVTLLGWNFLAKPDQTPDWVTNSRVYPAINATAHALQSLAPKSAPVRNIKVPDLPDSDSSKTSVQKPKENKKQKPDAEQGYEQSDRLTLDQVITTELKGEKDSSKNDESSDSGDQQ